ncbi:unnamed protein product [Ectocarpus sp. 8 AP-2014]
MLVLKSHRCFSWCTTSYLCFHPDRKESKCPVSFVRRIFVCLLSQPNHVVHDYTNSFVGFLLPCCNETVNQQSQSHSVDRDEDNYKQSFALLVPFSLYICVPVVHRQPPTDTCRNRFTSVVACVSAGVEFRKPFTLEDDSAAGVKSVGRRL